LRRRYGPGKEQNRKDQDPTTPGLKKPEGYTGGTGRIGSEAGNNSPGSSGGSEHEGTGERRRENGLKASQ